MGNGKLNSTESANTRRTGEKVGWTLGWLGGFIWLLILSILWLVLGRTTEGLAGLALFVLAVGVVFFFAPWRHPATQYWKLMLPVYLTFFASVGLVVWGFGDPEKMGLNWWSCLWVLPCLIPLGTVGKRRWEELREEGEKR